MRKVYLAGPDVFRVDAELHGKWLKSECKRHKFEGLFPLDNECSNSLEIYEANTQMIKDCDFVLANIVPFRGPSLDPGTAFEIGYAKALDKPVFMYCSDNFKISELKSRTQSVHPEFPMVEDFGLQDNLMVSLSKDDGSIHPSPSVALRAAQYYFLSDDLRKA